MSQWLHFVLIILWYSGEWMASYYLKDARKTCKPNNYDLNRDWNKKHFSSLLNSFQLSKIVSDLRVRLELTEAALHRCSWEKVFWKYAASLQELLCNFIEITLRHGRSPVKLRHTFRTIFPKSTLGWLLLN